MTVQEFGARIRELRQKAGMTQKELADKVGIDFTYLSKIENGVMPPPSEKVILRLAEALDVSGDELSTLAGKVPADIAQLLSNPETLQLIRSQRARKRSGAPHKTLRDLSRVSRKTLAGYKFLFNNSFARVAIALTLVLAVAGSLWFAAPLPVKAVSTTITSLPTTMYTGGQHSFYVQVDTAANEAIPILSLKVEIAGPTTAYAIFNVQGTITSQSGHFARVSRTVAPYWGYGLLRAYGYGYQPPPLAYREFLHNWGYGYGYGYGYDSSYTTQTKYLVTLNTGSMSTGSYSVRFSVTTGPAGKKFVSGLSTFTMTTLGSAGGGAAAVPPPSIPAAVTATGVLALSDYIDAEGNTTTEISLTSTDGQVIAIIPAGTRVLDAQGNPLTSIEIVVLHTPPPPPGYSLVGPAYDCLPDGATFEPAFALTFTYDPANIPAGVDEGDLVMAYYDGTDWVMLTTTVDATANTVTASVAHFTAFAILAKLPVAEAAAFSVSSLSITPSEVEVGGTVTVSVSAANTGGLAGTYKVTFKVDGAVVSTKDVTLNAGATEAVSFTTTEDTAGTYNVEVNGLVGEFTVTEAAAAPTPTPTPAAPLNWTLIGGIIAAVVVIIILVWVFAVRRRGY